MTHGHDPAFCGPRCPTCARHEAEERLIEEVGCEWPRWTVTEDGPGDPYPCGVCPLCTVERAR